MVLGNLPIESTPAGYAVSTEFGTTLFGLIAGVGGAISNLVAGQRLSGLRNDTLPLRTIALPVAISIVASAGSAFLLPSGGNSTESTRSTRYNLA
jgi:hypothetical protein